MKKYDGYYRRLKRQIVDDAYLIVELLQGCDAAGVQEILNEYFKSHWYEFKAFWAQSGEVIDWVTFACMPHNCFYYIAFVFNEHPNVYTRVMNAYHSKEN